MCNDQLLHLHRFFFKISKLVVWNFFSLLQEIEIFSVGKKTFTLYSNIFLFFLHFGSSSFFFFLL